MKIYVRLLILLSVFTLASCESWLDLKPETEATEEQVFSTVDGYRSALNGLYKSMASASLYGKELTFAMLDCMSQQYDLNDGNMREQKYIDAGEFNYRSTYLNSAVNEVWAKGYNMIANANNLIQNLEKCSPDLFERGDIEKNMMLGEAYACRALMHFDLLRLYAPAPVSRDEGAYVPYVETYPNIMAEGIGVTAFMDKVIRDLERARELTIELDTSAVGQCFMESSSSRFRNTLNNWLPGYEEAKEYDDFFKGRGYRLNYYAITAILARAYLYAEKYDDALTAAEEVINAQVKYEYYSSVMFSDASFRELGWGISLETGTDLRLLSNLVFALYNEKAYDQFGLEAYFSKDGGLESNYFVMKKSLFTNPAGTDESALDYRYSVLRFMAKQQYPLSAKYYCSNNISTRDKNVTIIPMVRTSEMQYIAAECYARQNDFAQVQTIFYMMKLYRGIKDTPIDNWAAFQKELINEARREWIGEGQLFFLYKRLNADVDLGGNVVRPLTKAESVLPIPDDQSL